MKLHLTQADWIITILGTMIVTAGSLFIIKLGYLTAVTSACTAGIMIYAFEVTEK